MLGPWQIKIIKLVFYWSISGPQIHQKSAMSVVICVNFFQIVA